MTPLRKGGSAILIAIFLTASGLITSLSSADLAGTDGFINVGNDIIIRQGNGVNYSFVIDEVLTSIQVRESSIELNDWIEIGAVSASGELSNVLYAVDSDYIKWTLTCADNNSVLTYTLNGLPNFGYEIYKDGVLQGIKSGPMISIATVGNGTIELISSSISLWIGVVVTIGLGLGLLVLGLHREEPIYLLLSGLIWLFGGVIVFSMVNTAWTVLLIGIGVIVLFQGGMRFATKV